MSKTFVMFSREELRDLRNRALELAEIPGLSPTWQRALLAFADAADRLDAMQARNAVWWSVSSSVNMQLPLTGPMD